MPITHADFDAGERLDITVEFVTRRAVDCDGERVHRLLVTDESGNRFAIVVAPDREPLLGLQSGAKYRITGLLCADPIATTPDTDDTCPECDGGLRFGRSLDATHPVVAQAAPQFDIDEPFGVADAETSVRTVQDDPDAVDDWTPMGDADDSPSPPDWVCLSCGRHVAPHELRERSGSFDGTDEVLLEDNVMESAAPAAPDAAMSSPETVGLAAGGAKDATNFRENVENGYTPRPEAISDEGLFYDYYFETGERTASDALFAPRYATAVSEHPLTGDIERYVSVGLDSSLSVSEFERPQLDLVAVLDVSGSMDSPFDAYYYDEHGRKRAAETDAETKLEAATQSLCALTEQLRDDDRLGVVLYNHRAHVAKPLRDVGTTDMPAIRRHIKQIAAGGGTNLADGFEAAVDMLVDDAPDPGVEQRVVFMTDMMPNTGTTEKGELTQLFADAAAEGVHTTFVGMGLDANAELADTLSGIRGANHYFVHSADEFERRLGDEFDYMVTPLVYDLDLELDAEGYEIEAVHGSPSADAATDRLLYVGTLFPSAKQDGEARGGVVLVRLAQTAPDADVDLVASWTERDGSEHRERVSVTLPDEPESFAHSGVRKAVALARYARELRAWAEDVRDRADGATGVDDWLLPDQRGDHEQESVPLVVPERYADRFAALRGYLETEMEAVGDETLQQEIDLLASLCHHAPTTATEVPE